jgi:hypothetical protein
VSQYREQYAKEMNYRLTLQGGAFMQASVTGEVLRISCTGHSVLAQSGRAIRVALNSNEIVLPSGSTSGDVDCAKMEVQMLNDEQGLLELHNVGFTWVAFESPTRKDRMPVNVYQ